MARAGGVDPVWTQKMNERAIRWACVTATAVLGYVIAAIAFAYWVPAGSHFPWWIVRVLVPMANLNAPTVDPDWGVALLLWGPVNVVLYGLIGLIISQKLIDRIPAAD